MEASSPALEPVDARLWHQAGQLEALLAKLVKIPKDHALSDIELSHREVRLLFALGARAEMTMTDLAAELDAPLSTVTRMADRLETKGLIERLRSVEDRRIVLIRGSERGRQMYAAFERHHFEMARRMLEPLSPGEREILLELMEKLTRGLGGPSAGRADSHPR